MVNISTPFGRQEWDTKDHYKVRRSLTLKAKVSVAVGLVLTLLAVVVIVMCTFHQEDITEQYWFPTYVSNSTLAMFPNAAISTDAPPCAVIGKDILKKNGSAVDAAIAVLLCMGVVNPESCGLGGGFFMMYYNRTEKQAYFYDSRETAPSGATVDMFNGNATLANHGGLAIAIPSEILGYEAVHSKFGVLPWAELFPPTIELCRNGIEVGHHLDRALAINKQKMKQYPDIERVFTNSKTGELYKLGEVMVRNDLAKTLEILAKEKSNAIYGNGTLAEGFLNDLIKAGSIITREDLQNYEVKSLPPVRAHLRGNHTVFSTNIPGGGPVLTFILNVIDGFEDFGPNTVKSKENTVVALHRMIETFKFAYAQRMDLEDSDTDEMHAIVQKLTSRQSADDIRKKIDDVRTHDTSYYGVNVTVSEDHGTAHMSVIAPNGDAVAVTSTVNVYFGSMVLSPTTGIILNNEMDDFSSPNITNYFGIPPTQRNHVRPGKRPMSSMSPAIIVNGDGDVVMSVGANGGTQITTSVAQTIIRNLYLEENIKGSIDAPRFHHQLLPDLVEHEKLFPEVLLDALRKKGHKTKSLGEKMLGIVMGITRGTDGFLYANSDYRKGGKVDGF